MRKLFFILILSVACIGQGLAQTSEQKRKTDTRLDAQQYLEIMGAAINTLQRHFVDSIDWAKVMTASIDAMLGSLDPYTEFYTEEDTEDFKTMTTGEYAGIGAVIQQNGDTVIVSDPQEGRPAQMAGLRAGDAILKVNGESMIKKTTQEVSEKLRGQANTDITVEVLRPYETEPRTFSFKRSKIVTDVVPYYGWLNDSIGYILLNQFTDKAAQDVQTALISFKEAQDGHNLKGVVLDLRDNPGGLLEEAAKIVSLFVPKGSTVVSTRAKLTEWESTTRTSTQPLDTLVKIAVLINRNSASASEIVSGAIQDMDRGVIMGERSYGKGLVQNTRPLPYNTLMKFTSAKYYTPSGRCVQAIDYSHRNEDGSVGRIPDSLTHVFHTAIGREVRDGGGIKPDIEKPAELLSNLEYFLILENLTFKYATYFRHVNSENRELTDNDYEDFKKMVEANKRDTIVKALKLDLMHDLDSLKVPVMNRLKADIALRYGYQKAQYKVNVENDKLVGDAVELLADDKRYRSILSVPATLNDDKAKKAGKKKALKAIEKEVKKKK
ncbi:MAG: S41 family peptidase [Bacteroidales bacterium]|nr:S41 family peptidase [Bacteroidales bacterium]